MWKSKVAVRRANARLERHDIEGMDLPYFKITFDDYIDDVWLRFRIVPAWRFNWKIFETLQKMYIEETWASKWAASKKAIETITDFYKASDLCSKQWTKPFKVYITEKNRKQINDFITKQL